MLNYKESYSSNFNLYFPCYSLFFPSAVFNLPCSLCINYVCVCVCVALCVFMCGCVTSRSWFLSNSISLMVSSLYSICTQNHSVSPFFLYPVHVSLTLDDQKTDFLLLNLFWCPTIWIHLVLCVSFSHTVVVTWISVHHKWVCKIIPQKTDNESSGSVVSNFFCDTDRLMSNNIFTDQPLRCRG